jgi:hypothetical protein
VSEHMTDRHYIGSLSSVVYRAEDNSRERPWSPHSALLPPIADGSLLLAATPQICYGFIRRCPSRFVSDSALRRIRVGVQWEARVFAEGLFTDCVVRASSKCFFRGDKIEPTKLRAIK